MQSKGRGNNTAVITVSLFSIIFVSTLFIPDVVETTAVAGNSRFLENPSLVPPTLVSPSPHARAQPSLSSSPVVSTFSDNNTARCDGQHILDFYAKLKGGYFSKTIYIRMRVATNTPFYDAVSGCDSCAVLVEDIEVTNDISETISSHKEELMDIIKNAGVDSYQKLLKLLEWDLVSVHKIEKFKHSVAVESNCSMDKNAASSECSNEHTKIFVALSSSKLHSFKGARILPYHPCGRTRGTNLA